MTTITDQLACVEATSCAGTQSVHAVWPVDMNGWSSEGDMCQLAGLNFLSINYL